jgi:hypothetical protein
MVKYRRWLIVLDEVVAYRTSDSKFVIGKKDLVVRWRLGECT